MEADWLLVSDITRKTLSNERKRTKYTNVDEFLRVADREKRLDNLFQTLSLDERVEHAFERSGYVILMNPSPDGNCQFNAVADQLRRMQISSMSASQVRQATWWNLDSLHSTTVMILQMFSIETVTVVMKSTLI